MWLQDSLYCLTAHYPRIVDHHMRSLDGSNIDNLYCLECASLGTLVRCHSSWIPGLWWLAGSLWAMTQLIYNQAVDQPSLPREGLCFVLIYCITAQGRSSHTSQQRLGRYFSNAKSSSTETPSGFHTNFPCLCNTGPLTSPSGSRASLFGSRPRPSAYLG